MQTEKNASTNSGRNWLTQDTIQKFAAFLSLILMIIFFSIATPYFFVFDNLITIALQTAVIGIIAIGVTFVIITAGIDLSVGSVLALSGVSTGLAIAAGVPIFLGVLIGMMVGTIFGFISAWLVSKLNIPPFIATLGLMLVARGLTLVLTEGKPVYFNNAPFFKNLSAYKLFGTIPLPLLNLKLISFRTSFRDSPFTSSIVSPTFTLRLGNFSVISLPTIILISSSKVVSL